MSDPFKELVEEQIEKRKSKLAAAKQAADEQAVQLTEMLKDETLEMIEGQRSSSPRPSEWKAEVGPLLPTSGDNFTTDLSAGDKLEISRAVDQAVDAIKQHASGHKVLLYLGVGVGNPTSAWGNPTARPLLDMNNQINPPFLRDMVGRGYFVVGLNFNVESSAPLVALSEKDGLRLHVPAKFPLTQTTSPEFLKLKDLSGTCDRVVILNAVSQLNYPTLLDLGKYNREKILTHIPVAYVMSYGETGVQTSYATLTAKIYYCKPTKLLDEDDVFLNCEVLG